MKDIHIVYALVFLCRKRRQPYRRQRPIEIYSLVCAINIISMLCWLFTKEPSEKITRRKSLGLQFHFLFRFFVCVYNWGYTTVTHYDIVANKVTVLENLFDLGTQYKLRAAAHIDRRAHCLFIVPAGEMFIWARWRKLNEENHHLPNQIKNWVHAKLDKYPSANRCQS